MNTTDTTNNSPGTSPLRRLASCFVKVFPNASITLNPKRLLLALGTATLLCGTASVGHAQMFTIDFSEDAPNQVVNVFGNEISVSAVTISSGSISYGNFGTTFGGNHDHAQSNTGWTASDASSAKNFSFTVTANTGFN